MAFYGTISTVPSAMSALESVERNPRRLGAIIITALCALAIVAVVTVGTISATPVETLAFPQTDLDMINVMQELNGKAGKVAMQQMKQSPAQKGLTMPQQYARVMQNLGYFAPWSRQNSWVDRVAIANIRKSNTPQALAQRAQVIKRENAKFAKAFATPHTSEYTGKHESLSEILDPKFQPWGNDGPRKAYYQGY